MQNTKRRFCCQKTKKRQRERKLRSLLARRPLHVKKGKAWKTKRRFCFVIEQKKDKKVCPPPPSSLASTSSSSSSSTFYSSPVYYSPRSSLAFEASSRSLFSLFLLPIARASFFSLSLARGKEKKNASSGRRETKLETKRRPVSHARCPRVVVQDYICIKTKERE